MAGIRTNEQNSMTFSAFANGLSIESALVCVRLPLRGQFSRSYEL